MHRTTINVSESMLQQAKIKALREDLTVSEVIRDLLARWVAGEIQVSSGDRTHDSRVALARTAHGMWADRDPDAYLTASRTRLKERDRELARAHLDA
jgi:hypothetical protein